MSDINDPEKYEMATIVTKNSKSKHVEIQLELVPIKDCLSLRKDIYIIIPVCPRNSRVHHRLFR